MNTPNRIGLLLALVSVSHFLGACAAAPSVEEQQALAAVEAPECSGPKKRVAVLRFGGIGKYGAYEGWDVGDALAAQLTSALQTTGCFVVTDRLALSDILREQELGLAGIVNRETAAAAGGVVGAQILIKGEVTEFEAGKKGNGATIGLGLSDIPLGLRLGGDRKVAHLAIDIRLIDAATGEILYTQRVDSEAKSYGLVIGADWEQISLGTDSFSKTPFGEAARVAVREAAGYILLQSQGISWQGMVVEAQGENVFLNAGENSGLKVGDTLKVSTVVRELIDPATGVSLGKVEHQLGTLRVERVTEKYSIARPQGRFEVRRGDLLRM